MSVQTLKIARNDTCWVGRFRAMASPCEVHIEVKSKKIAKHLIGIAKYEAERIEAKFSRYRRDNIVWRINNSFGKTISVDPESARLLNFAQQCFELSDGLFDITSGVLGKAWTFGANDKVPDKQAVSDLLSRVGWQKLNWQSPELRLPAKMQLDFGGIGKEYAVDRTVSILRKHTEAPFLVNYGGDLHASAPPELKDSWRVGIEAVAQSDFPVKTVQLHRGALATSGDAQRYIFQDGIRYGHVLNPQTGWPALNAPLSVTVAGNSCIEAGVFSTLSLLKGPDAESFLDEQGVTYWCQR